MDVEKLETMVHVAHIAAYGRFVGPDQRLDAVEASVRRSFPHVLYAVARIVERAENRRLSAESAKDYYQRLAHNVLAAQIFRFPFHRSDQL